MIGSGLPPDHTFGVVPHRQLDLPVSQQSRRLARRPGLPERPEHCLDRALHALIRILANGLSAAYEAGRDAPVQRPAQRLVAPPALHPRPQHRQLRRRQRPLDAQHQLVIVAARQVHLAVLDDRHLVHPAQVQQLEPLDRVPRQPRHLDPEQGSDLVQGQQAAQLVEPPARPLSLVPGTLSLVAVNRPDPIPAPAHLHGPLRQPVLARPRLPVAQHLLRRRLAHIDRRQTLQLPRPDFRRAHRPPPWPRPAASPVPVPAPAVSAPLPAPSASAASVAPTPAAPAAAGCDLPPSAVPQRSASVQTRLRNARKSGNSPASPGATPAGAPRLVHAAGSQQWLPSGSRTFSFRPRTPALRTPMTDTAVPSSRWCGRQIVTVSGRSVGSAPSGIAVRDESGNVLRNAAFPGHLLARRQLDPSGPDAGPRQTRYSSRVQPARQKRLRQTPLPGLERNPQSLAPQPPFTARSNAYPRGLRDLTGDRLQPCRSTTTSVSSTTIERHSEPAPWASALPAWTLRRAPRRLAYPASARIARFGRPCRDRGAALRKASKAALYSASLTSTHDARFGQVCIPCGLRAARARS